MGHSIIGARLKAIGSVYTCNNLKLSMMLALSKSFKPPHKTRAPVNLGVLNGVHQLSLGNPLGSTQAFDSEYWKLSIGKG